MIALGAAWAFVRDSWIGKLLAAIVGILLLRAYWKHEGASEAKEYIARASDEAAVEREKVREEIDAKIVADGGSAERLRNDWSRD